MKPAEKPANPNFSSGPCSKRPGYDVNQLDLETLGRSHRSALGKAVLARAMAFDVPEMNCFIRRGAVVGRNHIDVMVPVQVGGDTGVTAAIIRNTHARRVSDIAAEIRDKAARSRDGE